MHQRQGVELPAPVAALRVAVDVVGDAVFVDQPAGLFPAAAKLLRTQGLDQLDKPLPVRAQRRRRRRTFRRTRPSSGRYKRNKLLPASFRATTPG